MRIAIAVLFVVAAVTSCFAGQRSLEELKKDVSQAKPQDQPKLYVEIAELELKDVDRLYSAGDVEKAHATVTELAVDCEKAAEASKTTRKHMKHTEISLRKIGSRLEVIAKNAAFDDRPPIEDAAKRVEKARTALLDAMFAK